MTDDNTTWTSTGMHGYSERGIPEEWDFGFGSVTGYRWWWWHIPPKLAGFQDKEWVEGKDSFSYLIGAYRGEWEPGRIEAKCEAARSSWSPVFGLPDLDGKFEHVPPANGCGCGFWGYFDPELTMSQILGSYRGLPKITRDSYLGSIPTVKIPILGAIEGTGRVVIGEKGFRSQYAQLKAVCIPHEARETLSYWAATSMDTGVSYGDDFYGNRYSPGAGTMRDGSVEYRSASEGEVMSRLTDAEEVLQEMYPDIKVCPDKNSMMKQFPRDRYYAED